MSVVVATSATGTALALPPSSLISAWTFALCWLRTPNTSSWPCSANRRPKVPPTLPEPMMPMFILVPCLSDLGLPVKQRLCWQIQSHRRSRTALKVREHLKAVKVLLQDPHHGHVMLTSELRRAILFAPPHTRSEVNYAGVRASTRILLPDEY